MSAPAPDGPGSERLFLGRFPLRRGLGAALRRPSLVVKFLRSDGELASALGVSKRRITDWRHQLIQTDRLPGALVAEYERVTGQPLASYRGGWTVGPANEILYLFVRALRPKRIVETGVAAGFSSAYLLQALHDNGLGEMVSIDLPTTDPEGRVNADGVRDRSHVPSVGHVGFVVPSALRDRWTLKLGAAQDLLPSEIASGPVDLFFHDSDHSYPHMRWEYELAWPRITPGGWLLSDDIDRNAAFPELVRAAGGKPFTWAEGHRGAVRRP